MSWERIQQEAPCLLLLEMCAPSILKGLLTRLGVHGPHVHFEGAHQGAASEQVLRMDHLPGRTTSSQLGWVGRSLWGLGVRVNYLLIVLTLSFLGPTFQGKVGRYLADDKLVC